MTGVAGQPFTVVERPDRSHGVGRPRSPAVLAFLATATTNKAIKIPHLGRGYNVANSFRVAARRAGFMKTHRVRSTRDGDFVLLWLEKRDG